MTFKVGDKIIFSNTTPNPNYRGKLGQIVNMDTINELYLVQHNVHGYPDSEEISFKDKYIDKPTKLHKALL